MANGKKPVVTTRAVPTAKPVATPQRTPQPALTPRQTPTPAPTATPTATPVTGGSGNPAAMKRMKAKTADPDKERVIQELRKARFVVETRVYF